MKGPKKKKPTRRDFIELAIILVVFAVIYLTGSQAKVFGKVQQAVLYTGIMNARELDEMAIKEANYNFKFTNESGQIVSAQTLKGKTVFMNIWATWCAPCVAEMPGINALYEKVKDDKDVVFLMISEDRDFQKAKDWIADKGFDLPIHQLASQLPTVYETGVVPTTFVISKDGKIVVKKTGMANYNTKRFERLLRK
ncbi:TlpA disulfide reductase family protein [Roseivirga sp. UBA838]|uniref:TlpA family protein disulfide reductase n=1 Tax=Roseivirga sp. UBA838 TaxID=1947393 RepID=UPI00258112A7|nr:TlpA disulfide reductase family protein [Roseivirga sp. UBA838]|tara:strand:+ start:709 stop:1296 length:588 start_codon:yes stop_codon:yes gene_type:complete